MDDHATGGAGLTWLHEAQRLIHKFHSAGFQVLTHSCYLAQPLAHSPLPSHASKTASKTALRSYMASHLCGRPTPLSNPAHTSNCVAAANQLLSPPRGFDSMMCSLSRRTLAFLRCSIPLLATVSAKRSYFQTSPSRLRTSSSSILRPSAVKLPRPPPPCWAYFSTPLRHNCARSLSRSHPLSPFQLFGFGTETN